METSNFPLALTFDDLLLIPGYSDFSRSEINLKTKITKNVTLDIPLVSSPMDTVTDSRLAIALGSLGGIGIIHRNLTINDEAEEVSKVAKASLPPAAAVGVNKGFEERIRALVNAGVKIIVFDSAHGYTKIMMDAIKTTKKMFPHLELIAGNISTYDGAKALIKAGADGLRVGMGPGAICTTRIISGMGVPQMTGIKDTVAAAKKEGIPVIADGGIKYSGDMVKALAQGASTVMMGSFFASTLEAPGKVITLKTSQIPSRFKSILTKKQTDYKFKQYRGMGSSSAMRKGAEIKSEDEFHGKSYKDKALIAEGVEGYVPVKGTAQELVDQSIGGIKSGFYYVGAKNINELWKKAKFLQITQASLTESHPHDVLITNPGENYQ